MLPAGVVVRTYDARSKVGRALAFSAQLAASLDGADAILAHMVPTFSFWRRRSPRRAGCRCCSGTRTGTPAGSLRVATALCTVALSVEKASYPIASPNVRGIGHAIDVDIFTAEPAAEHGGPLRLLAVGRTARWKGLATLLHALALAIGRGLDASLEIRGPSLTGDERAHREELIADDRRRRPPARSGDVTPPVRRAEIPALIAGSTWS